MNTTSKFDIPDYKNLPDAVKDFIQKLTEGMRRNHENFYQDVKPSAIQFSANDVTPSVKNGHGKLFYTANTGATTITDFDDADEGMEISVLCLDAFTSIADGGNFDLSANWTPSSGDTIKLIFKGGVWYELTRKA